MLRVRAAAVAVLIAILLTPAVALSAVEDLYGVWEVDFNVGPYHLAGYQFRIGDVAYNELETIDVPWKTHRPIWETNLQSNAASKDMDYVQVLPKRDPYYYAFIEVHDGQNAIQYWLDMRTEGKIDFTGRWLKDNPGGGDNSWYYNTDLWVDVEFNADYTEGNVNITLTDWTKYKTWKGSGKVRKVCDF